MEKGDLLADNMRKLDERGVKGFYATLCKVFKKTAESDKVIGLGDSF